jgi:hypothetical protein
MPFNKRYHSIAVGQWLFENAQLLEQRESIRGKPG